MSDDARISIDRAQRRQYDDGTRRYYAVSQVVEQACGAVVGYGASSAMIRGTDLHALFAWDLAVAAGWVAEPPVIPETYAGYVASWRTWMAVAQPEVLYLEKPFCSDDPALPFAGTPDCVCWVQDRSRRVLTVVDLKTGQPDRRHHLQVQAYGKLVPEVKHEALLYVKADGSLPTWQVVPREPRDWQAFQYALHLLVWRER